jgi:serine/threonine-protein kinase
MLLVSAVIAVAHAAGIIHRDLKPGNVFLARTRHGGESPKVLDFGISKFTDATRPSELTSSAALLGTVWYMSPEQCLGARTVTPASDQYALGVILYECLIGRRAFQNESLFPTMRDITEGAFVPPRKALPSLPEALEAVVLRAMHLVPELRYPSVRDFAHALLAFAAPTVRAQWETELSPTVAVADIAGARSISAVREATTDDASLDERAPRPAPDPDPPPRPAPEPVAQTEATTAPLAVPTRPMPTAQIALGAVALAALLAAIALGSRSPTPPPPLPPPTTAVPAPPPAHVAAPAPQPSAAPAPPATPTRTPDASAPPAPPRRPGPAAPRAARPPPIAREVAAPTPRQTGANGAPIEE